MQDKARATDLAKRLRDAAKMQDPCAMMAVELVKLHGDMVQESLVSAEGDDMLRQQGSARQLRTLHRELTVEPPAIAKEK